LAVAVDAPDHRHAVHGIGLERLLATVDLCRQQGIRLPRFLLEGDGQLLCAERLDRAERRDVSLIGSMLRVAVPALEPRVTIDALAGLALTGEQPGILLQSP